MPVDFSKRSRELLRFAVQFARQPRSQLILLHVREPLRALTGGWSTGYAVMPPVIVSETKSSATAEMESLMKTEIPRGIPVDTRVRVGQPYVEITKAARTLRVDLIIISTHGYTGWSHLLLDSTAEHLLRHATCPVLVIRNPR